VRELRGLIGIGRIDASVESESFSIFTSDEMGVFLCRMSMQRRRDIREEGYLVLIRVKT
jgi:hypothetical protein